MMDPITLILTALATGAAALAKGSLSEAGKDLYKLIKSRIQRKLYGDPQGQIVFAEYEKDPETWEKPLKKTFTQIGVEQDHELQKLASQLLVQINNQRGRQDVHIKNSNVINSPIMTGDFKVEQRGTYNLYVGQAEQVVFDSRHRPTEIREIKIDLRLNNGEYPRMFWFEEADTPNFFDDGRPQITREWWEPKNFSHDHLRKILRDEINKLSSSGWELVETDLDDLWQTKHNMQETLTSRLTNLVGMSVGRTSKHSLIIYGARFHVRHIID